MFRHVPGIAGRPGIATLLGPRRAMSVALQLPPGRSIVARARTELGADGADSFEADAEGAAGQDGGTARCWADGPH